MLALISKLQFLELETKVIECHHFASRNGVVIQQGRTGWVPSASVGLDCRKFDRVGSGGLFSNWTRFRWGWGQTGINVVRFFIISLFLLVSISLLVGCF